MRSKVFSPKWCRVWEVHIASYILYHTREVTYSIIQIFPVTYSIILSVTYSIIRFFQWRIVSYFSKLPNRSLRYYGGLKVKYKNGWHTVFEPVLGHIKFLGQIKAPLMLVWGLEHPGRPKGAVNPINGTSVVLARIEFLVPKCSLGMGATFLLVTFPNYMSN